MIFSTFIFAAAETKPELAKSSQSESGEIAINLSSGREEGTREQHKNPCIKVVRSI